MLFLSPYADAQSPNSRQTLYQRATAEWLACVDKRVPLVAEKPYPDKVAAADAVIGCASERRKIITELIKERSKIEKRSVSEDETRGVMDLLDRAAIEKATADIAEARSRPDR
jgi:hypothetical protein